MLGFAVAPLEFAEVPKKAMAISGEIREQIYRGVERKQGIISDLTEAAGTRTRCRGLHCTNSGGEGSDEPDPLGPELEGD